MQCTDSLVTLCRQPSYDGPQLQDNIARILASSLPAANYRSARILLKPNLITATNSQLSCTNARIIISVARYWRDMGAQVMVGDSPAFGSARSVLQKIGVAEQLEQLGAHIVEFSRSTTRKMASGRNARVAIPALECDYLINLPKLKAHAQMRLTMAVKNYFGCISGLHKPLWHMVHGGKQGHFADYLVELLSLLPPGYSLVDGVEAMHVTGPIHGKPYPLGLLAGARNPVAVDTALITVLAVSPERFPLWRAARDAGIFGADPADICLSGNAPADFLTNGFKLPEELIPVRFNPFRFIKSSLRRLLLASKLRGK
ncbi:DUF362 domain-containing protein [Desulfobulbus rhabdoformis]|jgi:uncharacterized protein (DUF362 family)|uniref:DUF362 domain-containing protein n=1 Tax=Desulfobulbus rhabdoformis TaxID=34032 RepID=UPI0019623669|nr:DUF362 domain-containing protein [Desulfobulbus rhabdoformis]MBM9616227.1 DUF362 domain-containing protein [Desulfobulbus rhabdoformis]